MFSKRSPFKKGSIGLPKKKSSNSARLELLFSRSKHRCPTWKTWIQSKFSRARFVKNPPISSRENIKKFGWPSGAHEQRDPIRFHHIWFFTKHVIPKNCLLWGWNYISHLEKFLNQKRNINPSISLFERMGSSALGGSSQDEVSTQQPWLVVSPLTGVVPVPNGLSVAFFQLGVIPPTGPWVTASSHLHL